MAEHGHGGGHGAEHGGGHGAEHGKQGGGKKGFAAESAAYVNPIRIIKEVAKNTVAKPAEVIDKVQETAHESGVGAVEALPGVISVFFPGGDSGGGSHGGGHGHH